LLPGASHAGLRFNRLRFEDAWNEVLGFEAGTRERGGHHEDQEEGEQTVLGITAGESANAYVGRASHDIGSAMDQGGSDSAMALLVTGILLLGGIGLFISWGLSNAYLPS
jgi:hypothetical protein